MRLLSLLLLVALVPGCILTFPDKDTDTGPAPDTDKDTDTATDTDTGIPIGQVVALGACDPELEDVYLAGCELYRVQCEGLPDADVKVRTWLDPLYEGEFRGTLVFGMGGTGTGWTVPRVDPSGETGYEYPLTELMSREGYKVLERAWVDGWWGETSAGQGLAASACRYRALVHYFANSEEAPICVFGNSGGSTEIAYALTRHGLEDDVRLAILGGGPPMGRVDLGCAMGEADAAWPLICEEIWDETQTECTTKPVACGYKDAIKGVFDQAYGAGTACSAPSGGDLARLRADSVVSIGADLEYPNTHVHFVHGRADCTEAPILGTLYWEALTSSKSRDLVSETPHRTIQSSNGAVTVAQAIVEHCGSP